MINCRQIIRTVRFVYSLPEESWVGEDQGIRLIIQCDSSSVCFQINLLYEDDDVNDCTRVVHQQIWHFYFLGEEEGLPNGVTIGWCQEKLRECWAPRNGTPVTALLNPESAAVELLMKLEVIPAFESGEKTWMIEHLPNFTESLFKQLAEERHRLVASIMDT